MKILILNTHSTLNSGDAGIVLAQVGLLRGYWPRAEISLTSRTPAIDRRFYSSRGVKIHPPFTPAPGVFTGKWRKGAGSLANLLDIGAKGNLLAAIGESDLIVSSGGGYLYSYGRRFPGPTFLQHILHLRLALIRARPVVFFPQSFGPFGNSLAARMCRSVLENSRTQKVFVRENISRQLLLNLLGGRGGGKVSFCPDLAFLLEAAANREVERFASSLRRPILVVTLRDWRFPAKLSDAERSAARENYLNSMLEVSSSHVQKFGGSVVVLLQARGPDALENDTTISREFVRRYKARTGGEGMSIIPPAIFRSPENIIDFLSRVDLVLATRFHSAVFAMLARTPVVTVAYQHKAAGMLRELGLERFQADISEISSGKLLDLMEELANDRDGWRELISVRAADARRMIHGTLGRFLRG